MNISYAPMSIVVSKRQQRTISPTPVCVDWPLEDPEGFKTKAIGKWTKRHLASGSAVISDGLACFRAVKEAKEGANKRGNSSRLTQSFHFFSLSRSFLP